MTSEWFEMVAAEALGQIVDSQQTYDTAMLALQHGIPGDFVECGVFKGARSALLAKAIMDFDDFHQTRRVHLFDSFQGMPAAAPIDAELYGVHGDQAGDAACSLEDAKANMQRWGIPEALLVYHPGWFENTIPRSPWNGGPHQIAVLRLDSDLYTSTKVCMEYLYPLLVPGGYLIIDDYDLSGCRAAVHLYLNPAPIVWRRRP